ncbi:MAG TPA: AraC family transcriptional regulator [Thermoanaerobaculia bacterium]|nr:AraC family transcriptional regulator [Thermoanaerobaculia bacterium]
MSEPSRVDRSQLTLVEQGWSRFYGGLLAARRRGAHDLSVLERLRRVRATLETQPGEPIDLEAMARAAYFSKFHFLRLFRQAYGETPARCLARLRLERARRLLETTDRSVTDICFAVGYESLASFSHSFRQYAGTPPQRYRRRWIALPRPAGPVLRVPSCFVAMYS